MCSCSCVSCGRDVYILKVGGHVQLSLYSPMRVVMLFLCTQWLEIGWWRRNAYWLLVICLLHMEQTDVVVFVDDLLVAFCFLFVGGPGFCATSPETRSLAAMMHPLWRRPRLVGRRRGLGLPCGSREIQPLILMGWIIWVTVRDHWFLHHRSGKPLSRWRMTGRTSCRRSLSSHCVTRWGTIVGRHRALIEV